MGGISIWQLLIIAVIVALLFGTKRLRTLGSDLGESIKGFQNAMKSDKKEAEAEEETKQLTQADESAEELSHKDKHKA